MLEAITPAYLKNLEAKHVGNEAAKAVPIASHARTPIYTILKSASSSPQVMRYHHRHLTPPASLTESR